MQRNEPSTTAHVVIKLLTAAVAFGTTIPNHPSIIMLFGCFRCLDFWINDLLPYHENPLRISQVITCDRWTDGRTDRHSEANGTFFSTSSCECV
jgi:hypothetical protein